MNSTVGDFFLAQVGIQKAFRAYDHLRPHAGCDFLTANQAHLREGALNKRWNSSNTKILSSN
jgi:hypothetical protein